MPNELFVVARDLSLAPDATERPISTVGFTCNEPELRAWMLAKYQIADGMPLRSAFSMLSVFGWTVLMVFPTDPVPDQVAAMLRQRAGVT